MFKAFKLVFSTFNQNVLSQYYDCGKKLYEEGKTAIHKSLSKYMDPDGLLNGSKIEEDWFPQDECKFDVFLSHSHKDEKVMIALAGFLSQELDLRCFIDSQLWGYAGELQGLMDEACCRYDNKKHTWNYDDRNVSTSYVHNMLAVALSKMMDKTEAFFFAETHNSTIKAQAGQTLSPWIYTELSIASILRSKPVREQQVMLFESDGSLKTFCMKSQVKFTPPLDSLINLSWYDIVDWEGIYKRNLNNENYPHSLDVLYRLKNLYFKRSYE